MALADVARDHYEQQSSLTSGASQALLALWLLLDPTGLAASWVALKLGLRMFVTLATFQVAAANAVQPYVAAALAAQRAVSVPQGLLVPQAVAGVASDGRPLESLLAQPLIDALARIEAGQRPQEALQVGGRSLAMIAATQVADAGRAAEQVAMAVEPSVTGWVRMLVPPSCGRCAILAGRRFAYNDGFQRHPFATAVTSPRPRMRRRTSGLIRLPTSNRFRALTRTSISPSPAPRPSAWARTSTRWSTPAAVLAACSSRAG